MESYACSTWKHILSNEPNSPSGRLRIKRLGKDWSQVSKSRIKADLERSSRTSSIVEYLYGFGRCVCKGGDSSGDDDDEEAIVRKRGGV